MLAFLKALSTGAEYLETDVQVSHDGIAVIAHDDDLVRLVGRQVRIDQLTMAELRRIDLGDGQSFSSLAEVLDAFPDARFNIDIKCVGAVEPTVSAILEARATDRVLIASFDQRRRLSVVQRLPGVATSASRRSSLFAVVTGRLGLVSVSRLALRGIDAVQLPARVPGLTVITPRLIRTLHAAGVEVHAWTINDPHLMRRLLGMGVDGIITDRIDRARELVDDNQ